MAPLSGRQALAGLAAGVVGTVALHLLKSLPWSLAAVVGLAIGVLTVASLRTGERLRRVWGDDPRWRSRR